jgi:crotonobetainyl-CoA:carnitine CoA-transferase CaiB-like acyl-CoA transferase
MDDIGEHKYPKPLYDFPESPGGIRRPPVGFGQDNEYVYKELLGIGDDHYERLRAEGHIATEFDASVP